VLEEHERYVCASLSKQYVACRSLKGLCKTLHRREREEFYRSHGIGYVARPPNGKGGFVRRGRFKKASNLNYCLDVSQQVEDLMAVRI
jgi:hypothetical protein